MQHLVKAAEQTEMQVFEKRINNGQLSYYHMGSLGVIQTLPIRYTMAKTPEELVARLEKKYPSEPGWTRVRLNWRTIHIKKTPRYNGSEEDAIKLLKQIHKESPMATVTLPITQDLANKFHNNYPKGFSRGSDKTGNPVLSYTTPAVQKRRKRKARLSLQRRRRYPMEYDIDTLYYRLKAAVDKKIPMAWFKYSLSTWERGRIKKTCIKAGKLISIMPVLGVDIKRDTIRTGGPTWKCFILKYLAPYIPKLLKHTNPHIKRLAEWLLNEAKRYKWKLPAEQPSS